MSCHWNFQAANLRFNGLLPIVWNLLIPIPPKVYAACVDRFNALVTRHRPSPSVPWTDQNFGPRVATGAKSSALARSVLNPKTDSPDAWPAARTVAQNRMFSQASALSSQWQVCCRACVVVAVVLLSSFSDPGSTFFGQVALSALAPQLSQTETAAVVASKGPVINDQTPALDQSQPPAEPIEIAINRIDSTLQASSQFKSTLRMHVQLTVTNLTDRPLPIEVAQFSLLAGETSLGGQTGSHGQPFQSGELLPRQQRSGTVSFPFIPFTPDERPLILKWTLDADQVFVVVNEQLRRLHKFQVTRIGPSDRLAIVRASDTLDILAMWPLHDQLRLIQSAGVERLVLAPLHQPAKNTPGDRSRQTDPNNELPAAQPVTDADPPPEANPVPDPEPDFGPEPAPDGTLPPGARSRQRGSAAGVSPKSDDDGERTLEITEEALAWLTAMRPDTAADGLYSSIHLLQLSPFTELYVAGFSYTQSRRLPFFRDNISVTASETEAIAAAMQSCYDRLPVEEAFADVFQPNDGLRIAALTATIDRLNSKQQTRLLQLLKDGGRNDQLLVIPFLCRLSDITVQNVLMEFCQSDDAHISLAALRSLMKTDHPDTVQGVASLWATAVNQPARRLAIVSAAIELQDYRWNELLAEHAANLLHFFAGQYPDPFYDPMTAHVGQTSAHANSHDAAETIIDADIPTDSTAASHLPHAAVGSGTQHAETLRSLLNLLPAVDHPALLQTARATVLLITETQVQDAVVSYIRRVDDDADRLAMEKLVQTRLQQQTLSDAVLDVIYRYPNPQWTAPLLKIADNNQSISAVLQRKVLANAVRGATAEQLEQILANNADPSPHLLGLILKQLASFRHPAWYELARTMLESENNESSVDAMDLLVTDGSEKSIELLNRRLRNLISGDTDFDLQKNAVQRSLVERLISRISLISHPEVCRSLNRCLRHHNLTIKEAAARSMSAFNRRSPAYSLIVEAVRLKQEKKYEEALQKSSEAVEVDPFSPDALLYRASFLLRADRLEEALADLQRADALNPEEPSTLNTIALVLVRQGKVTEGVRMAEDTLQLDPKDDSNLYNTCCTIARAAERTDSDAQLRKQFLTRAMQLLQESAANGFNDLDHLQNDPDLNILHDHDEWLPLVEKIRQAAEKSKNGLP